MTDIIKAIIAINPDAQVIVNENDVDQITWLHGTSIISKSDILAKQVELQTAYDAQQYSRNRAKEYPSIADQLDYIYHNGMTKWKADIITPVKTKYPKPD